MGAKVKHRESYDLDGISHSVPIPFGTRVGNMLFSSGIMGMDRMSGTLPTELETQVHHSFLNMRALLEKAGGTLDDVAHVRVLVRLEEYRGAVNAEWVKAFPDPKSRPARHTEVTALRGDMLIQLEMMAVLKCQ